MLGRVTDMESAYGSDVTGMDYSGRAYEVVVAPIGRVASSEPSVGMGRAIKVFSRSVDAERYVVGLLDCEEAFQAVLVMGGLRGVSVRIRDTYYIDGREDEWYAFTHTREMFSIRTGRRTRGASLSYGAMSQESVVSYAAMDVAMTAESVAKMEAAAARAEAAQAQAREPVVAEVATDVTDAAKATEAADSASAPKVGETVPMPVMDGAEDATPKETAPARKALDGDPGETQDLDSFFGTDAQVVTGAEAMLTESAAKAR